MAQNQFAQATEGKSSRTAQPGDTNDDQVSDEQASRDREHDLEAEQESAEAMDADVPQPPDASETTEGQPS